MADTETWECGWLVEAGFTPDGDEIIRECGAVAREHGKGWRCEAGHEHLGIEAELGPYGAEWQREQEERYGWR